MTLRLILTRHAKSSWDSDEGDHSRPLKERGKVAATALGNWLHENNHAPRFVLCSNALRTTQTWQLVAECLVETPVVKFQQSLYLASADAMFHTLQSLDGMGTTLLIGHNPGMAILAQALCESVPAHARFDDYPTGATTVLDFEIAKWADLAPGIGQVIDFIVPRELVSGR